jgi:1-acyl-sn-glycerol-3-phosphate acyltransferase
VTGAEHVPPSGGLLLAMNHLGSADAMSVIACVDRPVGVVVNADLLVVPVLGALLRLYGMVPVGPGMSNRAALEAGIAMLRSGGVLLISPEGAEKPAGLARGKAGAAFLAREAGVPVVPVAVTGTQWSRVFQHLLRLRRPSVTLTFGAPFHVPLEAGSHEATEVIMRRIADMLPEDLRGVYR